MTGATRLLRLWPAVLVLLVGLWIWRLDTLRADYRQTLTNERAAWSIAISDGEKARSADEARFARQQAAAVLTYAAALAARQPLTALGAELEQARARMEARTIRAPFDGMLGDVRVQPGQYLAPGTHVVSLRRKDAPATLLAFLPGYYRPLLRSGMPMSVELEGFRHEYQTLLIESVGSQIIGPVHSLTGTRVPNMIRKTTRPAMATMLATAGAHMYAAKWPRAFSTCPRSV